MTSGKKYFSWMSIGIVVLAVLFRLPLLNGSLWLDEAAQAMESARPFSQQLQITDDFQPPLIHILVHVLMYVSRAEWWLRTGAALIPGVLTILATYHIGKKLFSVRTGVFAAVLLATSSFHIFYSQELRPYSLPALFGALSWLIILFSIGPKKDFSAQKAGVFYAVTTLLGFYSSYLYPFLWMSQLGYVLLEKRKDWKTFFGASVAAGVGFLPWLPMFFNQLHAGQSLRTQLPGWEKVVSFDQFKSLALTVGKFLFGVFDLDFSLAFLAAFGVFVALVLWVGWQMWTKKELQKNTQKWLPLLCWLLLPVGLAWLVSFVVPVLQPKRVLFALPAFYLFMSYGVDWLWEYKNTVGRLFFTGIIALNLCVTWQYYTQPKYQREDWRSLYTYITAHYSAAESVVVFAFPEPFASWQWYDLQHYPSITTKALSTTNIEDLSELRKVSDKKYILVFDYLRDLTDAQNKVPRTIESYGFRELDRITPATPIGVVHIYARPTSVLSKR